MVTIEQPKEFLRVDRKLIAQLSIFMLLHERFDDITFLFFSCTRLFTNWCSAALLLSSFRCKLANFSLFISSLLFHWPVALLSPF